MPLTSTDRFLSPSKYIDWQEPTVKAMAERLALGLSSDEDIAKRCFIYVRDEIRHSIDHDTGPVTIRASDVLRYKVGFCFAKSHLLAALLRANGIRAGLCYQRLTLDDAGNKYCLHGLNAVLLRDHGWYRIDARGNKENVCADFCPPKERLAFPVSTPGEVDFAGIWEAPIPTIVRCLTTFKTHVEVLENIPDARRIEIGPTLDTIWNTD
ncbi:MAG: Transglutaminase-like superfamily protein [Methanomassiliicoccales archaeon PtaU1.Bin124]|nr:MAG: Transglutaminase-like superfamily protein [Methanomassiliicoccales archaeon PtaU1.Bin124]